MPKFGRPYKDNDEPKDTVILFRVSTTDKERLRYVSKSQGLSMSDYIYEKVFFDIDKYYKSELY